MAAITVLVVDDHQMVAEGIAAVLALDPRIQVVACAGSGAEALLRAGELRPDVAVVDLQLPDANGAALIAQLRSERPELHAVLISASFTPEALRDAVKIGITAFASKLASSDELAQVVCAAAEGAAYVSSDVAPLFAEPRHNAGVRPALTEREREVLQSLADGRTVEEIAAALHLSQHTVRNHIRRAMNDLGVRRRLDAVISASRLGLIELPE